LDVFEDEPLDKQSPLWDADRVHITPHNSFVGDGNGERLAELILSNLKDRA
jgi:phosphoglycerate dehydrogenase-like enzyme